QGRNRCCPDSVGRGRQNPCGLSRSARNVSAGLPFQKRSGESAEGGGRHYYARQKQSASPPDPVELAVEHGREDKSARGVGSYYQGLPSESGSPLPGRLPGLAG